MTHSTKTSKFDVGDKVFFNDEIFPYTVKDIGILGNKLSFEFLYTLESEDGYSLQTAKEKLLMKVC